MKSSVRSFRAFLGGTTAISLALAPVASRANPLGGQVTAGTATIQGQGTSAVTVNQSTSRAIIDWRSFDIAPGETTQFVQPGPNAVTLNRVTGGLGVSQINGMIKANGDVYVVNPDGILFGPSANVNVGGFLGTTRDIADSDFMAGKNHFAISGDRSASIVNQGTITAANGGFAALVAPGVRNDGVITANLGTVGLSAAKGFTLDLYGDNLTKLRPSDAIAAKVVDVATGLTLKSLVQNTGKLQANGGKVVLTAAATRRALDSVINSSGVVEANTVGVKNGLVVFGAATAGMKPARAPSQTVKVSGKIRAAGREPGTVGGKIEIAGEKIVLAKAMLDASGEAGGGEILVGGGFKGGAPAALAVTQNGQSFQSSRRPNATTVTVDAATALNASAVASGDGGDVVIWSNANTAFGGTILATGGSGGIAETSGGALSIGGATVHAGEWLLDPYSLAVDAAAASSINSSLNSGASVTLQTTASGATGPGTAHPSGKGDIFVNSPIRWDSAATLTLSAFRNIDVNADIMASGGGSLSLTTGTGGAGDYAIATGKSVSFTGGTSSGSTLSIGGHSYTLLYDMTGVQNINASGAALGGYYALATSLDATGVSSWTPIGTDGAGDIGNSGAGFSGVFAGLGNTISNLNVNLPSASYVGLFGYSSGVIRDLGAAGGAVNGNNYVGGVVGFNSGTISNANAAGSTIGVNFVGGLVGENQGVINQSYVAVAVRDNAAGAEVGGLVGYNAGSIAKAFATGVVQDDLGVDVGGLVGDNGGRVTNAFATGAVTGSNVTNLGGLVGYNNGTLTNVYATGYVGKEYLYFGSEGPVGAGLVGNNQGAIVNGYWDIDTSGRTTGVGPDSSSNGAIGLSATSGPSPFQAASYAGFSFGANSVWNVVAGLSFPYLQFRFPTGTPQVISGTVARSPFLAPSSDPFHPYLFSTTVVALVDGETVGRATAGYNGFYDLLVAPGTIAATGSEVLTYLTGRDLVNFSFPPPSNSFYDGATGSVTGLNISGHYLTIYSGAGTVTGIAQGLAVALGSQSGGDFIFSVGPRPGYTLNLLPDPLGLASGSQLLIDSSAASLNLDQLPELGSAKDNLVLIMTKSGASVTQTAPITGGGRLTLLGAGANFALTDAANDFSIVAARAANVELTDSSILTVSKVNQIKGVHATTLVLNDPGGAKESAPIRADNVLVTGAGAYTLTESANRIGTLAAEVPTLKLADGGDLVIGAVDGVDGVTTTNFSLNDRATVTQTQAITARNLLLDGARGTFLLTNSANDIAILAADSATIDLADRRNLIVGQVLGVNGIDAATLTLGVRGEATQTEAIAAASLDLLGASGNYVLTNAANNIPMLAANADIINLTDNTELTIGTVDSTQGVTATTFVLNDAAGARQAQPISATDLLVEGAGGMFTLTDSANSIRRLAANAETLKLADATALEIGAIDGVHGVRATTVSLNDPILVTQSKPIAAKDLLLEGTSGIFELPNDGNDIAVLAADPATIDLTDRRGLLIGQIFGVNGVKAGTFALNVHGKATQSEPITATALELLGVGGDYVLTNTANSIPILAADTDIVVLTDNTELTIGTVNSTQGVTATTFVLNDPYGLWQAPANVQAEGTGGVLLPAAPTIGVGASQATARALCQSGVSVIDATPPPASSARQACLDGAIRIAPHDGFADEGLVDFSLLDGRNLNASNRPPTLFRGD